MTPTTKCAVHVPATWPDVQSLEDRIQKNRYVLFFLHLTGVDSKGKRFQLSRQVCLIVIAKPFISFLVPAVFVPKFKFVALSDQNGLASKPCEFTQFPRQQNSAVAVQIDFRCVAHHEPLQAACLFVQAWQANKFPFDLFPVREWINKEAVILVHCGDQLAIATRSDPFPITGWYRQAPFGVQSYFGSTTKHGFYDGNGIGSGRAIPALAHLLPLFSSFQHYIRAFHQRQPTGPNILVVQGLRGFLVAEFGQIVAQITNYKSMS